jgi:hypothetical protein
LSAKLERIWCGGVRTVIKWFSMVSKSVWVDLRLLTHYI